jgi:hypothetical protein
MPDRISRQTLSAATTCPKRLVTFVHWIIFKVDHLTAGERVMNNWIVSPL